MQITKLVADGVEEVIQGLHLLPVGTNVSLNGGEYEVVDVEFMYANFISTVVVYLSPLGLLSDKPSHGFFDATEVRPLVGSIYSYSETIH